MIYICNTIAFLSTIGAFGCVLNGVCQWEFTEAIGCFGAGGLFTLTGLASLAFGSEYRIAELKKQQKKETPK